MGDGEVRDHDLLIRIDENVKAVKERCVGCQAAIKEHGERIALFEGELKAVKVRQGVLNAVAVAASGVVSVALRWYK